MKNRNGFSLIEVLVVIGIIALLAVFLVPNLMGARDRAKEAAVKGVMRSIQLAIESYNMENMTYPVASGAKLESFCKNYLVPGGYIGAVPKSPFTGQEYKDADTAGQIVYDYDSDEDLYSLKGYNRSGTRVILELTNM